MTKVPFFGIKLLTQIDLYFSSYCLNILKHKHKLHIYLLCFFSLSVCHCRMFCPLNTFPYFSFSLSYANSSTTQVNSSPSPGSLVD